MNHVNLSPVSEIIGEFPVTTTQERCWFLDRINPGEPALNVAVRWEMRGQVEPRAVERAFAHVIARHEILRTRFVERDGVPVQQVLAEVPFRLAELDLRRTVKDARMARIEAIAHEEAAQPFDLSKAGLIRATFVRFEAERAMLLIVAHQSVFDGYSIGVLGREIGTATAAFQAGTTPDLPELPLQFGDFAMWQQEYFASGVLEEEGAYWRETLAGAPYFEVPSDHPRPAVPSTKVTAKHRALPEDFATRLRAAAQAAGVTPFGFGAGVVAACLHRLTGADEVLMGTQIAGRMDVDLDPLIGVFINNLVLRQPTDPQATLADQVSIARGVVEGALAHQSMPFNRLVEMLNPPRDASRNPLISVNFNLLEVFMKGERYGAFELISVPSHAPGSVYDLQVVAIGRPEGGWRLIVEYRPDLFTEASIEALLDLVEAGFRLAMEAPETALADLPLPEALANRGPEETAERSQIAEALTGHPMVAEAAVVDGPWAFVTAQNTGTTPLDALPDLLMAHLDGALPPEARPQGVSILADLPRTARGAVNGALLRAPARRPARAATSAAETDPEILAALRRDWQEILDRDEIPPMASFFDLGGHSLLVVRLLARLRARHGLTLGIAAIYENATLTALAAVIAERVAQDQPEAAEDWRILHLSREGEAPPLVAINNAATGLALGSHFAPARPVTCVRLFDNGRGYDAAGKPFEEIAAAYAEVVRSAHGAGPYLLYGNCVHGNLALEAARILANDGAQVQGVVMKDVWEPGYTARLLADPALRKREKLYALKNRMRMVRDGRLTLGAFLGSYRVIRSTGILQAMQKLGVIDRVRLSDLEADQERFIATVTSARDAYRPLPVDLPVLHVVTGITAQGPGFKPSIGWEDVVLPRQLTTVTIADAYVHHDKRVGIDNLAREIEAFVTKAQASGLPAE